MTTALAFRDRVKQAVATGGTGALVLGAAATGFQALGAADDGLLFPYVVQDGSAWECGYGTYANSGTTLTRTTMHASSTGSPLNVTTSAVVFVDATAAAMAELFAGGGGGASIGLVTMIPSLPLML